MMTTLAVASTLIHTGVTSFQALLGNNRLTTQANLLMQSIVLARSEAIKRNTRVTLAKIGENWEDGWIGFVDSNANATLDEGEELLVAQSALPGNLLLTGNRSVRSYISYTGQGHSEKINGAFQAGRLMLCDRQALATPEHARAIVISSSGRPRISRKKKDLRDCLKGRA
jgi:type IV fimbrial biogenesis protein FimT